MKKLTLLSLFSVALMLVAASDSYACSCMAPSPDTPMKKLVVDAKDGSDAVFVGKVVSVRTADENLPAAARNYVSFSVLRSWKGVTTESVEILTAANSAMCGVGFEVGKQYIVYANKGEAEVLSTNICTRTRRVSSTSRDERYLGTRLTLIADRKQKFPQ